ncbi:sugar ABC transporter ATP-binding protein [Rhodobacter sp. M37P]|uniref:Sugar ABC transporter ATP-binding protein n=2 Tax=Rhodobacter calidifons TaxID=2715277 RepID=A0ABX0G223_9RHOB|nr:sugar ABC transporter ATP-binding protein [Rhodobacter calidifons]
MDLLPHRRADHLRRRCGPVDQKGVGMTQEPILKARGLTKRYGKVIALNDCDFDLYPGEILAVIGDNGAGKSTLIKAISGAVVPDEGQIWLEGREVSFKTPIEARAAGIETVYQTLAMSPALSIADNMFMGRELRKPGIMGTLFRQLDRPRMEKFAREKLNELGLMTIQNINQAVETLSGGQRQGVAVARAAAFGSKVVILDEPTAALGVKESRRVLELIRDVKNRGIPIILISHNMPHVFEIADRIHIHRLGRRLCVIRPQDYTMSDAVAFMTGARLPEGVTEAA